MNEPKKRGRPSKAEIATRIRDNADPAIIALPVVDTPNGFVVAPQTQAEQELKDVLVESMRLDPPPDLERAQTYALRIWAGQTAEMKRDERIRRCEAALQGQSLPTEGVRYPGGESSEVAVKFDPKAQQSPAQVLAMKIWAGQSTDVHRHERIARIERALQEQGLSTAGIMYPASIDRINVDDDEPAFWRMKMPGTEGIV